VSIYYRQSCYNLQYHEHKIVIYKHKIWIPLGYIQDIYYIYGWPEEVKNIFHVDLKKLFDSLTNNWDQIIVVDLNAQFGIQQFLRPIKLATVV